MLPSHFMEEKGLSSRAKRLLVDLGDGTRARNVSTLVAATGLSESVVRSAVDELSSAGMATMEGRRVRRTNGSGSGSISGNARLLLDALPQDGSLRSNLRLRSEVDLDDDAYAAAKQELIDAGRVQVGRGRGGRSGVGKPRSRRRPFGMTARNWSPVRQSCTNRSSGGSHRR